MSVDTISVRGGDSHSDLENEAKPYQGYSEAAEDQIRDLARKFSNESDERYSKEAGNLTQAELEEEQMYEKHSHQLIKTLTSMSQVPGINTFDEEVEPRLNPESDEFDSKFWVKNLRKLMDSDLDYYKPASLGVVYKDLRAYGIASDADYQTTVMNGVTKKVSTLLRDHVFKRNDKSRYFDILKPMDALIKPGEVTVVLGRPGAGCSTLLKSISAHNHGFHIGEESKISYDGLTPHDIRNHYRGDVIYNAETDAHFPQLTVWDTLEFAAKLRTPQNRYPGVTRSQYAKHMTAVYMATYGLTHTRDTKVGNNLVRGVSGGERKRVSIAEVALSGASLQCWDNATRGLDAATALEFIKALKVSAVVLESTPLIAIYQCSQDAYDLFDNVVLLYEGYQIFFGPATKAKRFFLNMGYSCPPRQTTADFLTSLTNPAERIVKAGFESKVPRTAQEFSDYWKSSPEYADLIKSIDSHMINIEKVGAAEQFHASHVARQSKHTRPASSYVVSYWMQVKAVSGRNIKRIKGDPAIPMFQVLSRIIMGFILGSMFYNTPVTSGEFFHRGGAVFFGVLFNSFSSLLEVMSLYEARTIVEKHKQYSLYHPSADSLAGIITDLPVKVFTTIAFALVFYFLVNLRREPGNFFLYILFNFVTLLAMSHMFRTIGAATKSMSEAMTPAAVLLLGLSVYTGFVLPTTTMLGWSRWINYINPVAYCFESLMVNEFDGVRFACGALVPQGGKYDTVPYEYRTCSAVGAVPGQNYVDGTAFINSSYEYYKSHVWRNFGILWAYVVFFLVFFLVFTEYNEAAMQKGEVILFQKSTLKKLRKQQAKNDVENGAGNKLIFDEKTGGETAAGVEGQIGGTDIFHWRNLSYDIQIKKETRRILSSVDGWVKPGTLTALMGATGAGKTTLLDVLADRVTMGVITGDMFVNGRLRDSSFQRSTGYAQQQDLHLSTTTVREAFRFSAYLRQPATVSKEEKDDYVERVIDLLEMTAYADAVVGVAGEGLNVEQRKRLTIGVELAAKPKLLLFLDEPTSGLDSQTAWSICKLIRKLANSGQAILCTIHQPSAILLQEFDRLLFLSSGGKTVYFGDMGEDCQTLINYFESHGSAKFPPESNPAEFMLHIIGAAPGSHANQDYHQVWLNSKEYQEVQLELSEMERELVKLPVDEAPDSHKEFATGLLYQYIIVTKRLFEQYWRTPSYIYSKLFLTVSTCIFNGFTFFQAKSSLQGLQNQMFSMFMFCMAYNALNQQMLPQFMSQRALYEARERPAKTFSWVAFIMAQITAEIPWNMLCGTVGFFCWYYPVGFYGNATSTQQVNERGALAWLYSCAFYIFSITMGQMCVAGAEYVESAGQLTMLFFMLSLTFSGVLVDPSALPGFWIFMYRVSPLTYYIHGMLATGLSNGVVSCADREFQIINPPSGETCYEYLGDYMSAAGGYLKDEKATSKCEYCSLSSTNQFLESVSTNYGQRWRNYGIFICYIFVNFGLIIFRYWLARVPKRKTRVQKAEQKTIESSSTASKASSSDA